MIGNIVSGIQSRIQDVASAVSGVADRIRSFLHFSVPDEGPLADMESWMPDFMQGLANGITTNTSLVTAAAENLSTTLSTSITNSMRGVEQAYSKSWAAISQTVKTGTAGVSAAMRSAWSSITTSTTSTWNSIKTTIQTSFAAVKSNVTSATVAVKSSMTSAWNAVKSLTTTSWNGIKTVITTAWNGIKSLTTSATASVKSSMTSAWNAVKNLTNTSWNGIKTVITTAWNSIKSLTTSSVTAVRSTVTSGWNTLKSTTTSAFNSIKSTVSSAMSSLRSTVSSGVANIRSSFNSLGSIASSAYRWGADICSQMAAGVRAAASSVIAAAENVASRVRSLLHFSVPDEGPLSDADTYMPDFMKLLATGIKKNVKSVVKAVQGLAGSMSDNLTTPVDSLGDWMDSVVGGFATSVRNSQRGISSAAGDVGRGIQTQLMRMGYNAPKQTVSQFQLKGRYARQYLSFAGKSSKDFLLYLSGPGVYDSPAADVESTSVPGRNGDIITENKRRSYRMIGNPFPEQRLVSFQIQEALPIENGRVLDGTVSPTFALCRAEGSPSQNNPTPEEKADSGAM